MSSIGGAVPASQSAGRRGMGGGGLRLRVPCGIRPARHAMVGAVARHDPLACRRRIRRRERRRLRPARCMVPPLGGTVYGAAFGRHGFRLAIAGRQGGFLPPGFCPAGMAPPIGGTVRPPDRAAQNGGGETWRHPQRDAAKDTNGRPFRDRRHGMWCRPVGRHGSLAARHDAGRKGAAFWQHGVARHGSPAGAMPPGAWPWGVPGAGRAIARPEWCCLSAALNGAGKGQHCVVLPIGSTVSRRRIRRRSCRASYRRHGVVPPIGGTVPPGNRPARRRGGGGMARPCGALRGR